MLRRRRIAFLYWGRHGALPQFTLELARAAARSDDVDAMVSVSTAVDRFEAFRALGDVLVPIETFRGTTGALRIDRLARAIVTLRAGLRRGRCDAAVTLMPHVWTPLIVPFLRGVSGRYAVVVHDGQPHPGDPLAFLWPWLHRGIGHSDLVFTLSPSVAGQLEARECVRRDKLRVLFNPDLTYDPGAAPRRRDPARPLRLLFFGRILPYKGLPMFVDALEILRRRGVAVSAGVYGEGALGPERPRLAALGAHIDNRWIAEDEIPGILAAHDAVVLSHVEASQSGTVAAAMGAGLPAVVTPVGGLAAPIADGKTGIVAGAATSEAVAAAIERLATDAKLYDSICEELLRTKGERSMTRFLTNLRDALFPEDR